ncbi:unnamed protein product, partial [marine sediment metagenome]
AVDDQRNYTAARLRLCRDSQQGDPVLFYTQELSRNFKDPKDQFGNRHLIKVFTPGRFQAAADEVITGKFQDALLAHKSTIPDYSPMTDIHSTRMNLFMDAPTAQFLEDDGIRIDGLTEDFQGIESVSATPFMDTVAQDASLIKREVAHLKGKLAFVKDDMADYLEGINVKLVNEDVFAEALARAPKVPADLVQTYLSIRERLSKLEGQLGHVQSTIFQETAPKIRMPRAVENAQPTLAIAV